MDEMFLGRTVAKVVHAGGRGFCTGFPLNKATPCIKYYPPYKTTHVRSEAHSLCPYGFAERLESSLVVLICRALLRLAAKHLRKPRTTQPLPHSDLRNPIAADVTITSEGVDGYLLNALSSLSCGMVDMSGVAQAASSHQSGLLPKENPNSRFSSDAVILFATVTYPPRPEPQFKRA